MELYPQKHQSQDGGQSEEPRNGCLGLMLEWGKKILEMSHMAQSRYLGEALMMVWPSAEVSGIIEEKGVRSYRIRNPSWKFSKLQCPSFIWPDEGFPKISFFVLWGPKTFWKVGVSYLIPGILEAETLPGDRVGRISMSRPLFLP